MAGFKGQATYRVDKRNRTAIPKKMRLALRPEANATFTLTRGLSGCIMLFPIDTWTTIEDRVLSERNMFDPSIRAFMRQFMMWAEEVRLDHQGRISLPGALVKYANINENVLIIGVGNCLEMWDPETFAKYENEEMVDYDTHAAKVLGSV